MTEVLQDHRCSKCGGSDMVWRKDKSTRLGGRWRCKPCSQAYMLQYKEDNAEKWQKQNDRYKHDPEYRQWKLEQNRAWRKTDGYKQHRAKPSVRSRQRLHAMNANLKANYGIDLETYLRLYDEQGGGCAICGATHSALAKGPAERLCVDHCHDTGQIRGLLCKPCNTALGAFRDSSLNLQRAIRYLNGGNADVISAVLHAADAGAVDGRRPDACPDADPGLPGERA